MRVRSHDACRLPIWLALVVMLSACGHRVNTQIVVRIDSDLTPVTELAGVHVVVHRANQTAPTLDRTYTLGTGSGEFHLPGEIGLVATDPSDHGLVTVDVSALLVGPGATPLTTRAIAAFEPGHTVSLPMFLARGCEASDGGARPCSAPGQTCGLCGCEPEMHGALGDLVARDASDIVTDATAVDGVCNPAHAPALPSDLGDRSLCGDAGVTERVFAVQMLTFGFPPRMDWRQHGFDLDNVCTDPSVPGSAPCTTPGSGGIPVEDGDRGRDNAFSSRIGQVLEGSMVLTEQGINGNIASGLATIAVRVRNYGGGPDDGQVTLEVLPVVHGHRPDSTTAPPQWDGHDVWHIDGAIAYDPMHPGVPAVRVDTAYVVGGTLVARLQSHTSLSLLRNSTSYVRFNLSGLVVAGALGAGGTALGPLDFGGWITLADLRNDLGQLGLCAGSATYLIVSSYLDSAADMYIVGDSVTIAPAAMCNAISIGFGTTMVPITLGADETSHDYEAPPCGDGGLEGGFPIDVPGDIPFDIRGDLPFDIPFPRG